MKKLTFVVCLLVGVQAAIGQSASTAIRELGDCSPATQRMLEQSFSVEKQLEIKNSPQELACLEYVCSRSYEFAPGQTILRSQKALFNIQSYKQLRRVDQRITIYDEQSGASVILYSWNEVEAELIKIRTSYQLASTN
jgi:hypothetical protein